MSDDESGMAAVLIAHLRNYGQLSCACDGPGGWNTYPTDPDHAAHVAAALAEAGYGHVGQARAEAWERGNNDGLTFAAAPQKSLLTNPYRADREAAAREGGA